MLMSRNKNDREIEMELRGVARGGLHETGTNSDRYEPLPVWNFCSCLHETGTRCLVPGFGMKRCVFSNKYIADPKAYRLEISGPGLRISRLGCWTCLKSDRSEFSERPVPCKRIKRNVWRPIQTHAGLSLSLSPLRTPLLHVLSRSQMSVDKDHCFSLRLKHSVALQFRKKPISWRYFLLLSPKGKARNDVKGE